MAFPTETIDCQLDSDGLLKLQLNRPQQLNAFTVQMCAELERAFELASQEDAVRVVLVSGAGRAFCAGMDLSTQGNVFGLDESQQPLSPQEYRAVRDTGGRVALAIFRCSKPVIAAVNGPAIGIGATMLLPMDIRLAAKEARFGFVFSRLGIVNEGCSSWFLPRIVGLPRAMEWLLRGHIFDADEALASGLVRELCPGDELMLRAEALAREIAMTTSPVSIALIRQMVYRASGAPSPLEAHRLESLGVFYTSMGDGREGLSAFLEKRPPNYTTSVPRDLPPFYPWWTEEGGDD